MINNIIPKLRLGVYGVSLLFSIIVLGLDAYVVDKYHSDSDLSAPNALGVADAVLTLVSLGPLLATGILRQGAMVSVVLVDLVVGFILWVLWLTAGAYTASKWSGSCSVPTQPTHTTPEPPFFVDIGNGNVDGCDEAKAAAGFSFLTFFALLSYWVTLLVFSVIAMTNGNRNIWMTQVNDANFDEKSPQNVNAPSSHVYPPQQQNLMQPQPVPTGYQGPPV